MGFGADARLEVDVMDATKPFLKCLFHCSTTGKYFLQTNGNMFNLTRGMEGVKPMEPNVTRLMTQRAQSSLVPLEVHDVILF
jgi:hypothetical protein